MFDCHENLTLNIGNNNPVSMNELIDAVNLCLDTKIDTETGPSRPGDMIQTHADIESAKAILGWEPTNTILQIVDDEIKWQKTKIKKR